MVSSLVRYDPDLFESQENAWRGVLSYYQHGGDPGDPWGGSPSSFRERNTSFVPLADNQHLKIFETCNFASNMAYYHMNIALARYNNWVLPAGVVRGLAQSSAALALGSAFYHGSHTRLGSQADNKLIGQGGPGDTLSPLSVISHHPDISLCNY